MEQQINLSLDKTTEVKCDRCDNKTFISAFLLRKINKFLSGTDKDGLLPINVMMCSKCGHVNEEFIPFELKNEYAEFEEINDELPSNARQMDTNGKLIVDGNN